MKKLVCMRIIYLERSTSKLDKEVLLDDLERITKENAASMISQKINSSLYSRFW